MLIKKGSIFRDVENPGLYIEKGYEILCDHTTVKEQEKPYRGQINREQKTEG